MPPAFASWSGELLAALAAKALSKSGRLVDTNLETLASRSSSACAAETVGRRSEHGVSVGSVTTVGGKTADNASIYVRVEGRSKLQTSCPCRSWYSIARTPALTLGNKRGRQSSDLQSLFLFGRRKNKCLTQRSRCDCEPLSIYEQLCWEGACSFQEHLDAPPHILTQHMPICVGYIGT